jgi:hypothetical protein
MTAPGSILLSGQKYILPFLFQFLILHINHNQKLKGNIMKKSFCILWQRFISLNLVLCMFILFPGCKKENNGLSGTITFNFNAVSSDVFCYVFLDDDAIVTNGYVDRLIIPITSTVSSVDYSFDTADVPAGSYYLLGGYDFSSDPSVEDNTDADNPLVWEARAWYGGTGSLPPTEANVSDLNKKCNFTLTGLN